MEEIIKQVIRISWYLLTMLLELRKEIPSFYSMCFNSRFWCLFWWIFNILLTLSGLNYTYLKFETFELVCWDN